MPVELKNKNLSLVFNLPNEGYSGTRFSHIGKLIEVKYKGVSVTTSELNSGFTDTHGAGFYNEFDIETALNFNEVSEGEWFHKIGVGLLRKEGTSYDFMKKYEARIVSIEVESTDDYISYLAVQSAQNGFAYKLKQTYSVNGDGFVIDYSLKNMGDKTVKTVEYNHNFLQMNNKLMGKEYLLKYGSRLDRVESSATVNPDNAVNFEVDRLSFNATPKSDFFISDLIASKAEGLLQWELEYQNKMSISGSTNIPPSKMNIWGAGHVISPELFIDIQVEPNQVFKWQRKYEFKDLS